MGRRSEDRFVQQILPVACEFLFGEDGYLDGLAGPIREDDTVPDPGFGRIAEIERGKAESAKRLHKAKAALLVISKRMSGDGPPVMGRQPDFIGLGDQIADREYQAAFPNYHPAALPHGPQSCRSESVIRNQGADTHD